MLLGSDQGNEMGGTCSTHWEDEKACEILIREGKRPLRRSRIDERVILK